MTRICPKCGAQAVHRSHRRGPERILSLLGVKSRRCHECNIRFVTLGQSVLFRKDLERLFRKVTMVALAGAAVLAVVGLVVWLSRKEAAPSAAGVMSPPCCSRFNA